MTQTQADIYQEFYGTPTLPTLSDATFAALGVTGEANARTHLAGDKAWRYDNLKPRPVGSKYSPLGDSITSGAGSLVDGGTNTGSTRVVVGCYAQLMGELHPDRLYRLNNAGIGGDIIGGIGHVIRPASIGEFSIVVRLDRGMRPYHLANGYVFGPYNAATDNKFAQSVTALNSTDYTLTFATPFLSNHPVDEAVGWGMHGRLQTGVFDWGPEICTILAGTNDLNQVVSDDEIVAGLKELGQRCRDNNIEPIFFEILPRSSYMAQVTTVNAKLRLALENPAASHEGPYHLIPSYRLFAGVDGLYRLRNNLTGPIYTATAGSGIGAFTITVAGAGWSVNQWAGCMIRITGGSGVGQQRLVASNTATVITTTVAWSKVVDNTSVFKIDYNATAGGANTLTRTGAGWTVDAYKEHVVRIVAGTGAGQFRTIASNTATVLTTTANWGTNPDATSMFIIESDTQDGLHPSDTGHEKLATLGFQYIDKLPLRITQVPRSASNVDGSNDLLLANFATSFVVTEGNCPTGWISDPFFNVGSTVNVEAPVPGDNIVGNWATLTSAAGGSGSLSIKQHTAHTWAIGDWIRMTCRFRTTAVSGGFQATAYFLDGTGYTTDLAFNVNRCVDYVLICTFQIKSITDSTFKFAVSPNEGSGKLWVAEPLFEKIPALVAA